MDGKCGRCGVVAELTEDGICEGCNTELEGQFMFDLKQLEQFTFDLKQLEIEQGKACVYHENCSPLCLEACDTCSDR